jgi:hypothetical protein
MPKFAYWSVADGNHAKMMATCIASARNAGVQEEFHIWGDQEIPGAVNHKVGRFNKDSYIFKFRFLRNQVKEALKDYDYVVWIDADNYFVRHPGDFTDLLRDNKWFIQLESEMTSPLVKRGDWWGCPTQYFPLLVRYFLLRNGTPDTTEWSGKRIWNTNAGFWIVRTSAIVEFYQKAMEFYEYARNGLKLASFTEEAPLAFIGHMVDDPELNTVGTTNDTWACDWTGQYKDRLPDGKQWSFEDYMSGEKKNVNPAIVHAMRSKDAMVKAATGGVFPALRVVPPPTPTMLAAAAAAEKAADDAAAVPVVPDA